MSSSIGRRRGEKAARRKKVLAERRRQAQADSGGSLASRVERMARAPIHCCLLPDDLFETGTGMLLLARGTPSTGLVLASFLLDVFCLGVKDVLLRPIEASDLEEVIAALEGEAEVVETDPAYARKLLRDLVEYARRLGLEPPREYRTAERLFGDVSADGSDVRFEFGCDGRPLYIPGSRETPAQVRQRLEKLRRTVGEDGFDFEEYDEDDEDEAIADDEAFAGYDPAVTPDPREWLEMEEDERILRIKHYHRRVGLCARDDEMHAIMHVMVENQLARERPAVTKRTMSRLVTEGLDRHEAIHAVGSVLGRLLYEATTAEEPVALADDNYFAEVEQLTAESWRRDCGKEGSADKP
jgi:hypothetical protein